MRSDNVLSNFKSRQYEINRSIESSHIELNLIKDNQNSEIERNIIQTIHKPKITLNNRGTMHELDNNSKEMNQISKFNQMLTDKLKYIKNINKKFIGW